MATSVVLQKVEKRYGALDVIHGIDLTIDPGEFVVFVGPSGCGKSTLLRMIAGLEEITGGGLLLDNERMNEVAPAKRGIAMVFQSYALYPHMSVYKNLAFGLETGGLQEGRDRAEGAARRRDPADREAAGAQAEGSSPAASASASRSAAPSCASRASSSSTSRCRTSMPNCACRCASRSPACTASSATR